MFGVPIGDLAILLAIIVVAGAVTGVLAGLFGIGGGAVIVPVLYEAFRVFGVPEDVRMQLCIGTSMAIIVPTSWRSYATHRAAGMAMPEVVRVWAPSAVAGVAAGSVVAAVAPGFVFKAAFALIAGLIALKLLFASGRGNLRPDLPGRGAMSVYGFFIGLGSSLMGIAGGALATMVMTLHGKPIRAAVATAAGLGVPITIAGALGYMAAGLWQGAHLPLSIGFVSLAGLAVFAPISTSFAPFGARLAHRLPKRALEIGFGLFLLTAAARFVVSLLV